VAITVKFIGALCHASGVNTRVLDCEECSVKELIDKITRQLPELRRNLIHGELDDPRPSALILVNGREISVMNGLNTALEDGDEVVLIPVAHGG
jgi:MoaD family protein